MKDGQDTTRRFPHRLVGRFRSATARRVRLYAVEDPLDVVRQRLNGGVARSIDRGSLARSLIVAPSLELDRTEHRKRLTDT